MFDAIAKRYDLLNHVLSLGLDVRWRARAIREAHLAAHARVLDLCTGTADFALSAVRSEIRSEEHTSELQSRVDLVCRLLLENKKHRKRTTVSGLQHHEES